MKVPDCAANDELEKTSKAPLLVVGVPNKLSGKGAASGTILLASSFTPTRGLGLDFAAKAYITNIHNQ